MTNYLTSVGSQQVSITIASGSTTGTATITAVGSGAFIIYQGSNPSDTANLNDTLGRIEITNSTTVTATRGATGSSQTLTVNAVIFDGDTTNLVKLVQSGTIAIGTGSTSGTATISAVTNNNTATAILGYSDVTSSTGLSNNQYVVSLSGTTVTATKQFSGTSETVGYCVIEFQGSALNSSVQNISSSSTPSASSRTVTITSVTANNTFLIFGGMYGNSASSETTTQQRGALTDATTVTINTQTSSFVALVYNCVVVELKSGILNQAVQRGTIALAAATSNTATITSSVVANGFCNWLFNTSSASTLSPKTAFYDITQTNATTLTMTANASATGTGSYEVVEFPAFTSDSASGFNPYYSRFIGRIDGFGGSV